MNPILKKIRADALPATYEGLVALHPPRPLADKVAYENAVEIVDALAGHALNRDQDDYLEIMSDLVAAYEEDHVAALPKIHGPKLLQFLLEENNLSGEDLAKLLNVDRSAAYKILKGTRNLTTDHIRLLCERFSVSADAFM